MVCEFYAKERAEKKLLEKACFWWNQLAEHWNSKNYDQKFEFIEIKESVTKEVAALAIRPKLSLNAYDRKYLRSLRIRWEENEEDKDEDDGA